MHAACGYPVKSTWIKAIKAGNFVGWPVLAKWNINKYYPDMAKTPKGHLNQTRKNVRSTKTKAIPFEDPKSHQLKGKKVQDIFLKVYDVCDTVLTNQTGQFPNLSQSDNKYIMVMVEIDISSILMEPIKNRSDTKPTRTKDVLLLRRQ